LSTVADIPVTRRFAINVIEDREGRLLLLRRSRRAALGPGLWGFCAGHIEPGESPQQCSLREVREELGEGLALSLVRQLGPLRDSFYGGDMEIHLFHYRCSSGEVRLNLEHTAYAWVGRERWRDYAVMDGMDEDLAYLDIWPREHLNAERLPAHLR
jgi:8-oxo-dGTP diphosphatase